MYTPFIDPNDKSRAANSQSKPASEGPVIDTRRLQSNLNYLVEKLAELRQDRANLEANNVNSDGSKNPSYFREANEMREGYYQSRISDIKGELGQSGGNNSLFDSAGNVDNKPNTSFGQFVHNVTNAVGGFLENAGKAVSNAEDWFVSQFKGASNTNEDAPNNWNCTLASLLMVGRMFGKIGGDASTADSQIEWLRQLSGLSSDENTGANIATNTIQGALALGLQAKHVAIGPDRIKNLIQGLQEGKKFMLEVNPKAYGGSNTLHAVVLTAINGDTAVLYDPARQAPITIKLSELDKAMTMNGYLEISA